MSLTLYFYGLTIHINSTHVLLDKIKSDFSYFLKKRSLDGFDVNIHIEALLEKPDFSMVKGLYFFSHFQGKVYGWRDVRYVRYKESLVYFDSRQKTGKVISQDENFLYHYTYYMIIAKVGEIFDCMGFYRFHALGINFSGKTAMFAMPINGGKTTLGWEIMKDKGILLYSEDTPLITNDGGVAPFPVRLSFRPGHQAQVPEKFIRYKRDPIFGEKILVDIQYYGFNRVATTNLGESFIFLSSKSSQEIPSIKKANPTYSLVLLAFLIVTGKDCPQRSELFLRVSLSGLSMICKIFWGRLKASFLLWKKSKVYYFYMTTDIEKNAEFIKEYIAKRAL